MVFVEWFGFPGSLAECIRDAADRSLKLCSFVKYFFEVDDTGEHFPISSVEDIKLATGLAGVVDKSRFRNFLGDVIEVSQKQLVKKWLGG